MLTLVLVAALISNTDAIVRTSSIDDSFYVKLFLRENWARRMRRLVLSRFFDAHRVNGNHV